MVIHERENRDKQKKKKRKDLVVFLQDMITKGEKKGEKQTKQK